MFQEEDADKKMDALPPHTLLLLAIGMAWCTRR
jgi:hypothetical protein